MPNIQPPLVEHFFIAGLETSALFGNPSFGQNSHTPTTARLSGGSVRRSSGILSGPAQPSANTQSSTPSGGREDLAPSPGGHILDAKIEEECEPEPATDFDVDRPGSGSKSARSSATITASTLAHLTLNPESNPAGSPSVIPTTLEDGEPSYDTSKLGSFAAAASAVINFDNDDFESELRRFAEERESFLDSLSPSQFAQQQAQGNAGSHLSASFQSGPPSSRPVSGTVRRPNTWRRRTGEEANLSAMASNNNSALNITGVASATSNGSNPALQNYSSSNPNGPGISSRSSINTGSLRRRISTMGASLKSVARTPSIGRQASVRTARRISGYNSVIPAPAPFRPDPSMHPLARRYEPVLLDRYPRESEEGRCAFPDYVPMFSFPNDITVVSSDCRPRPTWNAFAMTGANGAVLHGVCITVWLGVDLRIAADLEVQCERWRVANMSAAEREFANSLGERLACEKAKLSTLMARLTIASEADRKQLAESISITEEKIGLISQLLRPVRHGAATKIEGLTDGESGLWIPRAYGIVGRDPEMLPLWKEWLKAVTVPMQAVSGALTGVPVSCQRTGMWKPIEQYVREIINMKAPSIGQQLSVRVRELEFWARKSSLNEIPNSRSTDLFPLFRALSIGNIVLLFEAVLAEMRIVLVSSHPAMLHSSSAAIRSLLYPLEWAGISIPLIPARLVQALDAPCPYIIGLDRRYENVVLPDEDDFVLVDLDEDSVECGPGSCPPPLPKTQRRKLVSLLQIAAPHHSRFGVSKGVPPYMTELFPGGRFSSEHGEVYKEKVAAYPVSMLSGLSSSVFAAGNMSPPSALGPQVGPVVDVFAQAKIKFERGQNGYGGSENDRRSPGSPGSVIASPVSRSDSGFGLREKRSEQFESSSRRSISFSRTLRRLNTTEGPTSVDNSMVAPTGSIRRGMGLGHFSTPSTSTLSHSYTPLVSAPPAYAPSVYAPSSYAPSTIFPTFDTETDGGAHGTETVEGHILERKSQAPAANSGQTLSTLGRMPSLGRRQREQAYGSVPNRRRLMTTATQESAPTPPPAPAASVGCYVCGTSQEDMLYCRYCPLAVHDRCVSSIFTVCEAAFRPVMVRATFLRCFASLLYTYRKALKPTDSKSGKSMQLDRRSLLLGIPGEQKQFMEAFVETQAFANFIDARIYPEAAKDSGSDPVRDDVALFDQAVMAKRNRGRVSGLGHALGLSRRVMSGRVDVDEWRGVEKNKSLVGVGSPKRVDNDEWDYVDVISRTPAKLEGRYM